MGVKIGAHEVGPDHPCFIIAEVGLAHEGSVGMAHAFVDAVAAQGVDAVKFQCHDGQADQEWRSKPEWCGDKDRQDYWTRTSFSGPEWGELALHAAGRGLEFLCSPFSVEAVALLDPLVPAWKIASGQVTNLPMLEACGKTGKPGIISGGLDTKAAILAGRHFQEYGFLTSASLYPTPPDGVGLERMSWWPENASAIGLSDHSGTIYPGIAAAALGANILEIHVTMSRHAYGPDTASSLTIEELGQLVEGVRFVERAMQPMSDRAKAEIERAREVYMA